MKRYPVVLEILTLSLLFGVIPLADASPVFIDFNAISDSTNPLYLNWDGMGSVTYTGGILKLVTDTYLEYFLLDSWSANVSNSRGWVVETEMRVDGSTDINPGDYNIGLMLIRLTPHHTTYCRWWVTVAHQGPAGFGTPPSVCGGD